MLGPQDGCPPVMTPDPHNNSANGAPISERDLHYLRILLAAGNNSAATTYYAGMKNCTLSQARAALKAMQINKTPGTPPPGDRPS
jgi:hypothetical protein